MVDDLKNISSASLKQIRKSDKGIHILIHEHSILTTLLDSVLEEVFIKDKDHVFVYANTKCAEALKVDNPQQLIGKTDFDFILPVLANEYFRQEQHIIRTGNPIVNQLVDCQGIPGEPEKWILSTKVPWRDEHGNIIGIIGVNRNITERIQAENQLLEYQSQLKSLATQLSVAEERQRKHLATELHDRIGQSLVISKLKLETVRKRLCEDESASVLADVCQSLDQTIQDTRSLTFDLSSPILYELGLEAALSEWLSEYVEGKHQLSTQFESSGAFEQLDSDLSGLLFRSVRELLINVIKHAKARRIHVRLHQQDSTLEIIVKDDGIGFDPDAAAVSAVKSGGFGLFSIRERIERLGGEMFIQSDTDKGTSIQLKVPIHYRAKEKEDDSSYSC